jgi:uncharacterized protein (DUF111 family)
VRAAHGLLPVPAPAVVQLLAGRGIPVRDRDVTGELVTPTGAALLAELADEFGPYPPMTVHATGFGAGQRDMPYPNLLRLVLGETDEAPAAAVSTEAAYQADRLLLLETNIDDMNPEIFGYVSQRLFAAGALDVWLTPIYMKKGNDQPGSAPPGDRAPVPAAHNRAGRNAVGTGASQDRLSSQWSTQGRA